MQQDSKKLYNKQMIKAIILILLISITFAQSSLSTDLAAAMAKAGITTTPTSTTSSKAKSVPTVTDPNCSQNNDVEASILIWLIEQVVDLKGQLANCCKAKKPQVVRFAPVDLTLAIYLHQQSMSLSPSVTIPSNLNVYALLVQVHYYHASINFQSHGYMSARMRQQGDYGNTAQYFSRKFNWYANTANELEIIPWRSDLPNILDIDLYDTYNTEGAGNTYGKNYYRIKLVGYMTF